MRDPIASPPPAAPLTAPLNAAPQSFGRSLVAPFAVGVLIAAFWAQVRLWIALALGLEGTALALWIRTLSPGMLLVEVMLLFVSIPAVLMLVSLVGERRLRDAGRGRQVALWTSLAIALIALFLLGNLSWIQLYALTQRGPQNDFAIQMSYRLGDPSAPAVLALQSGFAIGIAAAYALTGSATGSVVRQLLRWLVVGALAGFGVGILDATQTSLFWLTQITLVHVSLGSACSGPGCTAAGRIGLIALPLAQQVGAALIGAILGGALRTVPARVGRGSASAASASSGATQDAASTPHEAPAAVARARTARLRGLAAALGLGILYGLCWVGALALALAIVPGVREPLAAVGIGVLLLALPLVAIAVSGAPGERAWSGLPGLAVVAICPGALPVFGLSLLPNMNSLRFGVLLFYLPNMLPVLSLGVAVGWAYSAGRRGTSCWWCAGTRAAVISGLGFGLVIVALIVTVLVQNSQQPACQGRGCFLGVIFLQAALEAFALGAIASPILALAAGPLGAWLRVRGRGATHRGA